MRGLTARPAARARAASCTDRMLSPPRVKKSSKRPTSAVDSSSANTVASVRSVSVRGGSVCAAGADRRPRQPGPVQFARVGFRQRVEHGQRRRHHVAGQRRSDRGPHRSRECRLLRLIGDRLLRHNISGQRGAALHLPGAGRRGADTVGRRQRGLDFGQLDSEAAHLDLVVGTSDELQLAVLGPAGQVAAAI